MAILFALPHIVWDVDPFPVNRRPWSVSLNMMHSINESLLGETSPRQLCEKKLLRRNSMEVITLYSKRTHSSDKTLWIKSSFPTCHKDNSCSSKFLDCWVLWASLCLSGRWMLVRVTLMHCGVTSNDTLLVMMAPSPWYSKPAQVRQVVFAGTCCSVTLVQLKRFHSSGILNSIHPVSILMGTISGHLRILLAGRWKQADSYRQISCNVSLRD